MVKLVTKGKYIRKPWLSVMQRKVHQKISEISQKISDDCQESKRFLKP